MHRHDKDWVTKKIMSLPGSDEKNKAWEGYQKVYKKAFDFEPVDHKKENFARRTANTKLRLYVAKFL